MTLTVVESDAIMAVKLLALLLWVWISHPAGSGLGQH
jgi:hypothetical protein